MSLLKLDKQGNLCEVTANGSRQACYVEDNNLAFGEYNKDAEKVLNQIKRAAQERKNQVIIRKRKAIEEYARQMGELKQVEVRNKIANNARTKRLEARRNRVLLEASKQKPMGYDYTNLLGNPLSGFQSEGKVIHDINLHGEGKTSRIKKASHFGTSTIMGSHPNDGLIGFDPLSFLKDAASSAAGQVQTVVRTVVVKAPVTVAKTVASGTEKVMESGVNVIQEKAAPTFLTALRAVGTTTVKAVESPQGMMLRKIIFNKYTDPSYPIREQIKILRSIPVLGGAVNTIDRYSGGTITNAEIALAVPGKLGRGEPVTKAELITAAVFALQAGAIIASGGSAAAIISVAASQMKQGPLGQTKEGRTLLTVAEIAALAYTLGASGAATGASAGAQAGAQTGAQAGAQAGTQVAQKTASEAVVAALKQKAQQELAKKAANEVAAKTGTGVLGQIAVSSALGPGTYQEAAISAGKQGAAYETGKVLGPEAGLIAQAAVAASERSDIATKGKTAAQVYKEQLIMELEDRARAEAKKRAEAEVAKQVGPEAAGMMIAYSEGKNLETIAKEKATAEQQKVMGKELATLNSQYDTLNAQKKGLLGAIETASPENREKLFNDAVAIDQKIIGINADRNTLMTKMDYAPLQSQYQLSQNASILGVSTDKNVDTKASLEQRQATAAKIKAEEAEKIVAAEKIYYDYVIITNNKVGELKEKMELEADLRNRNLIADADALLLLIIKLNQEIEYNENKAIEYQQALEVQKMQSAAKVAAAEEGRYSAYDIAHPMLKYGLI